jgi:class 3 adenylate cyclase
VSVTFNHDVLQRIGGAETAGTRLLISEALYERVKDEVDMTDFVRVRLRGTSDRMTLYEIIKLQPDTERFLDAVTARETVQLGGKT